MLLMFLMLISTGLFVMAILSLPSNTRYREMLFQISDRGVKPNINKSSFVPSVVFVIFSVIFMFSIPFLNPVYNVWKAKELGRAEGIRDANATISDGLGGPEGYLRWLTIQSMEAIASKEGATVIYIPTEAGVPVTESLRLKDLK